jgi:NAD(P)-dependent dehydrogenase (short-subunit alcohol dehydrogenase family)
MAGLLLEGKVILVTGSTTGIGEATARRCVAEGAKVMVHGRDEARAGALVEDLGENAAFVLGDLGDPAVCEQVVDATVERFGRIDGIANNAALTWRSRIEETDAEKFDRMIAVNTRAPLLIIRRALPSFRKQGGGAVVNIGSVNALAGAAYLLPYSVSKGGLATMSRNLANALAEEGVRVNHLNVGWVTSPNEIALQESEGRPKGWEKNVPKAYAPTGRLLIPEEVAAHVVFWLSDMSKPVSGAVYEVEQYSVIGRNRNTNEK